MPTAMAIATIAEASPGQVALAIGIGNPMFLGESGLTVEKAAAVALAVEHPDLAADSARFTRA